MKLSEAAEMFINRCYINDTPVVIQPMFSEKYEINGKTYKFTKEVCQEMKGSGRIKLLYENEVCVNLMGIK